MKAKVASLEITDYFEIRVHIYQYAFHKLS